VPSRIRPFSSRSSCSRTEVRDIHPLDAEDALSERLHEEFRRRVKTQGSPPSDDAALILVASWRAGRSSRGGRRIAVVERCSFCRKHG